MGKLARNVFWLSPKEVEILMRPMLGIGGMNTFLRTIQGLIQPDGQLTLTDDQLGEVTRMVLYTRSPKSNGGAQRRFREAFRRHLGASLYGHDLDPEAA